MNSINFGANVKTDVRSLRGHLSDEKAVKIKREETKLDKKLADIPEDKMSIE